LNSLQVAESESVVRREKIGRKCMWHVMGTQILPLSWISLPSVEIRFDPKITSEFVHQVSLGILEPVIVRRLEKKKYEIVDGVRRFLAARRAGAGEISCTIVQVEAENIWRIVLLQNTAREDLSPMDLAGYINEMTQKYKISQNEIAEIIGKDKSTVSNLLRMFHNPILREEVRAQYHSLQTAIELEAIAPRPDAKDRRRRTSKEMTILNLSAQR
jgi:ParB/RepB/Spo0J family partition protein